MIQSNKTKILGMFWIFSIGGVMGYLIETIWCYFAFGEFSSRTSNFFFPFSIVWAIGSMIMTWYLAHNRNQSIFLLFIKGCVLSALFEFLCGYIGEILLGVTFWDYRGLPLHIGKYVDVYISLFWGLLTVVWNKVVMTVLEKNISKIVLNKIGRKVTYSFLVFMIVTNIFSGVALLRMESRKEGKTANNVVSCFLDQYYSDDVIHMYFPKMKKVD